MRKSIVEKTEFQGSDDEAYQESEGADEEDEALRDDFSLSENNSDYEVIDDEQDEEKRAKAFFGDEDYTLLSKMPEEDQTELMSLTFK